MSDFFTKKQRKFWCDNCKIFIEYNKLSIDRHNNSKNHLRMINADQAYSAMKNKIVKHNIYNYGVENELTQEIDRKTREEKFLKNKMKRENDTREFKYSSGYGKEFKSENDGTLNSFESNFHDDSHLANSFLEEIKKDKMKKMLKEKQNINISNKNEKTWGVFFDPNTGREYYYNFITQVSQWERPEDYDGPEYSKEESTNMNVQEEKRNKNEGIIGKWEIIESKESKENKEKNELLQNAKSDSDEENNYHTKKIYIPGVISRDKYERLQHGEDVGLSDSEGEYEAHNFAYIDSPNNRITPMDRILNENQFQYSNIGKEDISKENQVIDQYEELIKIPQKSDKDKLIDMNKKLRRRDYDLRYVSQMYSVGSEGIQHEGEDELNKNNNYQQDDNQEKKVFIAFNQVKKNEKKISTIFNQDD
jgi:hypothetical protein